MRSTLVLGSLLLAVSGAHATVLFDNGPVVNGQGLSIMPATDSTYGYSVYGDMGFAVADDFHVTGASWDVASLDLYAYQPMGTTKFFFHTATWSIVSGDPNGGTVVASGVTPVTNGGIAGYRVDTSNPTNTQRAIFDLKVDIPDVQLAAGSYWLTWSISASENYDGPYTTPTADGRAGNAMQASYWGAYSALSDGSSDRKYDLPFVLNGSVAAVPEPASVVSMLGGLALLGLGLGRRLSRAAA